jgi:serine/threonine protein kinase
MVAILIGVVLRYRTEQHKMRAHDFEAELLTLLDSKAPDDRMRTMTLTDGLPQVPREIKRKCVIRTELIGKGQFGEVFKGVLDESSTGGVPGYLVACKSVVDGTGEGADDLLQEALVMAQVGSHPNLVSLIGVVTTGVPLLLVVSYCERGSLLTVLRDRAEVGDALSIVTKLRFAVHVASGMAHLASLHFIHRDLAARNVLVDAEFVGRVADFGLSRGTTVNANGEGGGGGHYYRSQKGVFPVRWTAPEAMSDLKFTTESDVWSFGVVMAEIFQDGRIPYAGVQTEGVIRMVCQGDRIQQPEGCPSDVYSIMRACWCAVPTRRPTFVTLIPGLQTELDVELALSAQNDTSSTSARPHVASVESAAPRNVGDTAGREGGASADGSGTASDGGASGANLRPRLQSASGYTSYSAGPAPAPAPTAGRQDQEASGALYRPMYAEKPQPVANAPPSVRVGITMAALIREKNGYADPQSEGGGVGTEMQPMQHAPKDGPQSAYSAVGTELQPIQHAVSDGVGYLDLNTGDPGNASQDNNENEDDGEEDGERGAPRKGKGINRDARKPSVYEGFGAGDEETRL